MSQRDQRIGHWKSVINDRFVNEKLERHGPRRSRKNRMMRQRLVLTVLVLVGLGLGWPGVSRGAIATFALGTPTVTPAQATFDVELAFEGDPGDTIEAIQLGVLDSDPLLTAGGTDFSRFAFTLDTATLPDWIELAPIGLAGVGLYAPIDPVSGPFLSPSASPYALGTLTIDLTGLSAGSEVFVTLAGGSPGLGTDVGGTVGGELVPSFAADGQLGQLAFTEPNGVSFTIIPEPGSLVLLGLGLLGLAGRARLRGVQTSVSRRFTRILRREP
jgi:hypothetical protein